MKSGSINRSNLVADPGRNGKIQVKKIRQKISVKIMA